MKAKTILEQQSYILTVIRRSLKYLLEFDHYKEEFEVNRSGHASTYMIYRDYVIINFFKLLNSKKEDYSFQNLIDQTEAQPLRKELLKDLSAIKKLYTELRILKIRNQHIGHLDFKRESESISWEKTKHLLEKCESLHDKVNMKLFDTQTHWLFEEDKLSDLLEDRAIRIRLVRIYRRANREGKASINIEEIKRIITGPNNGYSK